MFFAGVTRKHTYEKLFARIFFGKIGDDFGYRVEFVNIRLVVVIDARYRIVEIGIAVIFYVFVVVSVGIAHCGKSELPALFDIRLLVIRTELRAALSVKTRIRHNRVYARLFKPLPLFVG